MVNTLLSTSLYLFEEFFQKKLSTSEYFFVNSHQIYRYVSSEAIGKGDYQGLS